MSFNFHPSIYLDPPHPVGGAAYTLDWSPTITETHRTRFKPGTFPLWGDGLTTTPGSDYHWHQAVAQRELVKFWVSSRKALLWICVPSISCHLNSKRISTDFPTGDTESLSSQTRDVISPSSVLRPPPGVTVQMSETPPQGAVHKASWPDARTTSTGLFRCRIVELLG